MDNSTNKKKEVKKLEKITPRSQNKSKWYRDVLRMADLADYSPVRGCMVIKPYGYRIWELMKEDLDKRIKDLGVENAYFPLFIPFSFLQRESEHVDGFAPETAVVTHGGGKELEEKLVVRPTSETIIYSMFSKWVESYKDLPLKINQWANVVRWEKRTVPFIRTSEFLWQEGHCLFDNKDDAKQNVIDALKIYYEFLKEKASLYVVAGKKTESEKFAGAEETYSVESLMKDGKALQVATSHLLNHSFVKAFDVEYTDENNELKTPWASSWGISTRTIGGVILAHGDDKGLVLPPGLAPHQIILIPIGNRDSETSQDIGETFGDYVSENVEKVLSEYRVIVDWSDNSPGWKFAQSEVKGIPIRLELGNREIENEEISYYIRYSGEKGRIKISDLHDWVDRKLKEISVEMYESHKKFTLDNTKKVESYDEFKKVVKDGGYVEVFFDQGNDGKSENEIQVDTKAISRCMPFESVDSAKLKGGVGKCFYSDSDKGVTTLFARSY